MSLATAILVAVTAQRLAELLWSARNSRRLRARGALEHAPGHYPAIVAVHAAWLATLWLVARDAAVSMPWIAVFAALQLGRLWVLATLGMRWTTRILVLPGTSPVRHGPYRFLRHPNYAIVAAEIAVLPLALGMPLTALVFSLLNAIVLRVRIRAEDAALARADHG